MAFVMASFTPGTAFLASSAPVKLSPSAREVGASTDPGARRAAAGARVGEEAKADGSLRRAVGSTPPEAGAETWRCERFGGNGGSG
jgi:hypothetical protein